MNIDSIVAAIDDQISRLQQAKALLGTASATIKRRPGRPAGKTSPKTSAADFKGDAPISKPKRTLSPEARARMAAAQTKRWAASRKAAKKEARVAATKSSPSAKSARATKTTLPEKTETSSAD